MSNGKRRVGIVGYGKLGQFLASAICEDEAVAAEYELAFVWNRRPEAIGDEIEASLRLAELEDFAQYRPDLIVEVAHPKITETYGARFLATCDYMVGSPTAFATLEVEQAMRAAAAEFPTPNRPRPGTSTTRGMGSSAFFGGSRTPSWRAK